MFKSDKLKNGLSLVTAPVLGTKTVTILVIVGTGSKYENKKNSGISHFLEHMFFKGTQKRPSALALSIDMDSTGGDYNAFTSKEFTGFWMKVDADKTEKAFEIVSDMLINSKFETAEMEREKGVIIEEINMYEDNPMMHIEDVFEQCLYGDTPAGRDTAGSKDAVSAMTRKDFLDYFSSQYKAENTVVCIAGKLDDKAMKKIGKYFNGYGNDCDFAEKQPVVVNQKKPALSINFKKTDQAHLSLGVHAYAYGHPQEMALKLLSIILGGSMSSRLFTELREKRGLAYYVRTAAESNSDAGYLTTQSGIKVDKSDEAVKVIVNEYKKLKKTLVPKEELRRVKEMIRGKIIIQLESSDDVAEWYARQAIMNKTQSREGKSGRNRIYTPDEFFKKINRVSAEDIRKVANEIFTNDKLNLAVIGPYGKQQEEKLKKLLRF